MNLLDAAGRNLIHSEAYRNDHMDVPSYYTSPIGSVTRTNWQDEIYSTGYTGNYDLGVSGGSERARYNVAMGYLDQNGILKNSGFDRVNFRVNTEMDITKNLKFGENLMITHLYRALCLLMEQEVLSRLPWYSTRLYLYILKMEVIVAVGNLVPICVIRFLF